MNLSELRELMSAAVADRRASQERRRTAYELGDLLESLESLVSDESAPERTRAKALGCLAFLVEKAEEHGARFLHPSYLLNFVGEAMARENYVSRPIVAFLKTALYFDGLDFIDRNERARSIDFMVAHAETLEEFTSRASLKELVLVGRERLAAERPFCIVHAYRNALKKRYWADRRASEDAIEQAVSLPMAEESGAVVEAAPIVSAEELVGSDPATESRVAMMLRLFQSELTEIQQRVYLARHPFTGRFRPEEGDASLGESLQRLIDEIEGEERARWGDLAARFDTTEKTVKREYLRALLLLLDGASREVFGDRAPSSFVRRMIRTLRSIVQERDLRIRDHAGRGLGKIVDRWEIALRYVLNNGRAVTTGEGFDHDAGAESGV